MSLVIVDIDNEYCDELIYSYQLIKEDDNTYSVYVSRDILSGYHVERGIDNFFDAYRKLHDEMLINEGETQYA